MILKPNMSAIPTPARGVPGNRDRRRRQLDRRRSKSPQAHNPLSHMARIKQITERRSHILQTLARPLTGKLKYQPALTPAHYRRDEKGTAAGRHIHYMRSPQPGVL